MFGPLGETSQPKGGVHINEKTFKADISFEAGVYIERDAIDQQTGALDLRKIYLHATPSSEVRELHVTATISTKEGGRFVGILTAHMGPVKNGQKRVYAGVSCDAVPLKMIADPEAKLSARVMVTYLATTEEFAAPVQLYPPPK